MSYYVDVHAHLTHEKFKEDIEKVLLSAKEYGLGSIVVNGVDPDSNRQILKLAENYPIVQASLGIYPVNAVWDILPEEFNQKPTPFSVADEVSFIREMAKEKRIIAVGECGIDGYWLGEETYSKQEKVFEELIQIGIDFDIPVIVHSRKLEKRAFEICAHLGVQKVNFHCYSAKPKWAVEYSEKFAWCFSIPANASKSQNFQDLLKTLPEENILTETDSPYLAPERNTRNTPINVIHTVKLFAQYRGWDLTQAQDRIWRNYRRLFCA